MNNMSNLNLSKGTIPPLLKYKIVFLGDQAVGKSSIINRFIYDIFDGNQHRPTIGIDFISQNIFLEEKTIRLQLWDTAGQERFRALIPNYIRDTAVTVIVYDVCNRSSFNSLQKWIDDVKAQRGDGVIMALLANKIDLTDHQVTFQEGQELAKKNNLFYKEVSAKTGHQIQQFFKQMASLLPEIRDSNSRIKTEMKQQEQNDNNKNKKNQTIPPNIVLKQDGKKQKKSNKKKNCC